MPQRREAFGGVALGAAAAVFGRERRAWAQSAPAAGTAPPDAAPRQHRVRTPDGVEVAAYEYGNPQGAAILFIHGYMQAALSWDRQTRDPDLAREFRMVAYDIRGHGMSAKPEGDGFCKPGKAWADEVKAVIDALGLRRPVLVGWSYGGRIMGDYLAEHGGGAISAMDWVGATSSAAVGTMGRTLRAAAIRRPPSRARSRSCASASRSSLRRATSRPCTPST
jgi:non-heme chloroperoxidase